MTALADRIRHELRAGAEVRRITRGETQELSPLSRREALEHLD